MPGQGANVTVSAQSVASMEPTAHIGRFAASESGILQKFLEVKLEV